MYTTISVCPQLEDCDDDLNSFLYFLEKKYNFEDDFSIVSHAFIKYHHTSL